MNAYLFSAAIRRYWAVAAGMDITDGCASMIVCGDDAATAQKGFEDWCNVTPDGKSPEETEIKKIQVAQLVDQLFTETGGVPPDWPKIANEACESLERVPADDFEQGYWVEINEVVPPGKTGGDIETLRQNLSEDIRSGLNWAPGKKFFFLITVFSPPTAPVYPDEEAEADAENPETDEVDLDRFVAALPELREKEAAALVEARNSVVAAWLWRKYAADTRLAANEIKVSPCCGLIPAEYIKETDGSLEDTGKKE